MQWLFDRLKEPSTYAGFAALAAGIGISSDTYQAIAGALAAIFGVVSVVLKEKGII